MNDMITFNFNIGSKKTKHSNIKTCPFCNIEQLKNIYVQDGNMILLKNKYETLRDTVQLVLIESNDHTADIISYSDDTWNKILSFAIKYWVKMIDSAMFRSVVLYRNHGYLSGGTQEHPHMQIVGLKKANAFSMISDEYFKGISILNNKDMDFNVSTHPMMGLLELNVQWGVNQPLSEVAKLIKIGVTYIMSDYYNGLCKDYNLFFYKLKERFYCKIVPRFVTSQYFVGYQLSQCLDTRSLNNIKDKIKKLIL